jgi:lipoprotein-releasing system permease protein
VKRLEWFIARRYLASRHKGRFLSLITVIAIGGVFLGVMALITVIGVMTGLQEDLQGKIIGTNPHIYVFGTGGPGFRLQNPDSVARSIANIPGIVAVQPFVMTQVGVKASSSGAGAMLYGIETASKTPPVSDIEKKIRAGEYKLGATQSGKPPILIGSKLAERISAYRGDIVTVISIEVIKDSPTGQLYPIVMQFEVTDVFTIGMYEYDNEFMYTTLAPVQELLTLEPNVVSGLSVNVRDPWQVESTRRSISERLGFTYDVRDWKELNGALFSALKLEKLAMAVILFLIVLVAAFNIISTLIMVVADKTREIGILKSMGMTDSGVLRVFVLQGLTIGLVGTALGTIGGLGLNWVLTRFDIIKLPADVYFVDTLPIALNASDLVLILLTSLLIAFAATIYPSLQASRLLPVEAIRHD